MKESYIFPLEGAIRGTLKQLNQTLIDDRRDYERYKVSAYSKSIVAEKWDWKITAYMDAYNELEFLFNRAITVDHERSTYLQQICKLKDEVRRLNKYLNILSVTKKIEIEEQVKFKTEQRINQLCEKAEQELKNEIKYFDQAIIRNDKSLERRVAS
ncbi:hypothetical protein GCM10023188_07440 [Pontibacter saemangeumensis]|uniref:Flagellar FliJ protein n=1 Tax=Pontibacter saemangeumensis TaxID=1084525 RepID=A0ABP8LAF0_9BACT